MVKHIIQSIISSGKKIQRIFYLFYYLKELKKGKLRKPMQYALMITKLPKIVIIIDAVFSAIKYNISFMDYFCFRFYEIDSNRRNNWAGTGFMYEYQLRMNPLGTRKLLENKILFLNHYRDVVRRRYLSLSEKSFDTEIIAMMLNNSSGQLVLKESHGQTGTEVEIINCDSFTPELLMDYMRVKNYDLIEEFVVQHPDLHTLSPSGLNTVRIITQLDNNEVVCLGARLRISVNSPVDNMAAGNLAAPIDPETGVVCGPGVYSDITKEPVQIHPVTAITIEGFQIPYWHKVIELADTAARRAEGNRSVGWDIAVTADGPELIEGNHNWCKLLWQMPVNRGLKNELLKFL